MEYRNELYIKGPIKAYKDGALVDEDATVIDECRLVLFMNDSSILESRSVASFARSMQGKFLVGTEILPDNMEEFAIGYCATKTTIPPEMFTEVRVIPSGEDRFTACVFVDRMQPRGGFFDEGEDDNEYGNMTYSTDLGNNFAISAEKLISGMKAFTSRSEIFETTRAVHAAEIYDGNAVLKFMEDINKSNAIYKTLGYALSVGIDLSSSAIFSTGRLFKESVEACHLLGCKFMASKAVASKQAIEYAMNNDMTLVGMVRGDSFKVYCGEERIIYNNIE